jgi:hypothetical protein
MTRELRERDLRSLMLNDFVEFVRLYQQATGQDPGYLPPRGSTAEQAIQKILDWEVENASAGLLAEQGQHA